MPKEVTKTRQKKVDLSNLSQRDFDILKLDTKDVMEKYALGKQPVYDRRFALKKKIEAAGLTIDEVALGTGVSENEAKKTRRRKEMSKKKAQEETASPLRSELIEDRDSAVIDQQVPTILRPIEISFENFSLKLNGVPKKISVNPDTNAVEIDF